MTAQALLDTLTELKGFGLHLDKILVTFSPDANTPPQKIRGMHISENLEAQGRITHTLVFYKKIDDYTAPRELQ